MFDSLTAETLARVQFAFTVSFHIIFPAFSIGLASFLAVLNARWLMTRDEVFLRLFNYWKKIFAVGFGMGVVSGIVMSYQFGTNWAVFSDKTGPVLGPLMAYEVLSAFFLEAGFLGIMYYFVPKRAERPVYSYRLSIVHFWSLIFIYMWAGPHHLHYTALPDWAQTLGMTFSIMLWMPSWGGMINGMMTLSGAWHKLREDPVLRFMIISLSFYGMSTFEGPLMSIKSVNSLSHYTDWTIGHVHSGALGWVAFISFGAMYHLIPRLWNQRLYSMRLVNLHLWIATTGIVIYICAMWVSGILQGLMWRDYNELGFLEYSFVESVMAMHPMYVIRAIGGGLFVVGALIMVYNFYMTVKGARREEPEYNTALNAGWKETVA